MLSGLDVSERGRVRVSACVEREREREREFQRYHKAGGGERGLAGVMECAIVAYEWTQKRGSGRGRRREGRLPVSLASSSGNR